MPDNHENNDKTRSYTVLTEGTMVAHYRIIKKIGAGGMGEVFLAEDSKLGRKAALKFLPAHLCRDEECRTRFEREARAAAGLSHPNIITVFEVSEYEGRPYIAMEYVEGKLLIDAIKADRLRTATIIRLAIGICKGLKEAHEAGIIHRDVKPSNIIIDSNGIARILDFGLANIQDAEEITRRGITLGTAAYMSPEQVAGRTVDHRSDLFSFGVVLYEMVTGRSPFRKNDTAATLHAVTHDLPQPIARYSAEAPEGLQRIIEKALQKNAELRYQNAADILADLKREKSLADSTVAAPRPKRPARLRAGLLMSLAAAIIIVLMVIYQPWRSTGDKAGKPGASDSGGPPSIAVMPFANLSADPDQEYFCDGMTDEIINALANVPGLRVVARTSSFAFKGKDEDIREIGRKLNVKMLLEGSIRKAGDRLKITARLVNVADGYHLWSDQYNKTVEDVFAIQEDISRAIVDSLKVTLVDRGDAPLVTQHTGNMDAYQLYLKGRFHWNQRSPEGLAKSLEYFRKAIEVDSNYALAYSGLADAYIVLADYGMQPPKEAYANAKRFTKMALDIDPHLIQALVADAYISFGYDWSWTEAESKFLHTLSPDVNYATGFHWYAEFLSIMGRFDEAGVMIEKALELDPLSPIIITASGANAYRARRYSEAIARCQAALELNPDFMPAMYFLMLSHLLTKDYSEAIVWLKKVLAQISDRTDYAGAIDKYYSEMGATGIFRWIIDNIHTTNLGYNKPYYLAVNYGALGARDSAFYWLDEAYRQRCNLLLTIKVNPDLDSLRSDPRFDELLKKMNLLE